MNGIITTHQAFHFPDSPLGAQEAAMLRDLLVRDPAAHDALIARVFRGFDDYDNTPEMLDALHEELLQLLTRTA